MTHADATTLFYRHVWPHRAMVLRTAGFLAGSNAAEDLAQYICSTRTAHILPTVRTEPTVD